jgi:hypothetical protein
LAQNAELGLRSGEARSRRGVGTVKKDWAGPILGRTLFPRAEDIPQSLAMAFMRMMMEHANFELQVRALQSAVANDRNYGEQARNQWTAVKRPRQMVKLIEKNLGQIPETEAIKKLLQDAIVPSNQRNRLAHGTWWSFDPRTTTISVRGGVQREDEDQFSDYTEERILGIADAFEALEAELYKLRRNIKNRRGDHDFDWAPPP